ncbi:neurobeachin-like protein 2 [Cricetulus griseus]|uniref:Death domain-containing membrane protein NRADD n=1 Tax=Cricetulus griseus TaxID=10029 RepID=A0A061I992_CRIGR|nr:neurobeachin-like protein 2 [Cricetulus griseus]
MAFSFELKNDFSSLSGAAAYSGSGSRLQRKANINQGQLKGSPSQEGHRTGLENVALHALLLCEGLFDPYQTWRRQHSGEVISSKEKSKYKFPPAALPGEFGAFFQESLQDADCLPPTLLLRLIHLFGAVLAGGMENGQIAVSAGSVQGLLGVVRGWGRGRGPAQDLSQVLLALKALVGAVHVLHASRAPPRGPELRTLLEGYFHILNADWPASPSSGPEEALVTLRVSMLDAIPMMLACEDRPVLQATFLSNNCFEHLIRLIQNSKLYLQARAPPEGDSDLATRLLTEPDVQKVLDQDTDAIAVHVVRVLTCIMSGSPSAKEVFKERIGYQHLQEVLQSHGPPTHRLLQELLNMAVEGDHSMHPPPPIRNEQPVLVLMQWLPALPTAELRLFLAQRLWWLCDSCPASRATCVQAGLDVVNCVGGMGALLPLLERVAVQPQEAEAGPGETHDLVGPELTSGHNTQGLLLPLGKSSEERMERNAVAAFLLMLRSFLQGHTVNQESLVQCQGPAIIGALLRKVPSWAMDMNVLMSAQLLMEQVAADSSGPLLYLLYQHLLFNFHLWALSDFAVRLGHIQYMSSIVREHRQKLRKKYGVQFILDALRTHYSPQRERPLAADDLRTVQTSLLGLAREFLVRSFSVDDMQVVLSFLAATSDDGQVVGTLDLLLALLQGSPSQEPLAAFLLEPGNLEVLLTLLVRPRSPPLLTDRVCKILRRLQQNERLPERNRQRLRLRDCGLQGLVASLPEGTVSLQLCQGLYKLFVGAVPQVASPDCLNLSDLLAVVQLSLQADLSVRLDICRQLFHLIYGQPEVVRLLARQAGWQNVLTRLYVLEAATASSPPRFLPELPTSLEPALSPPPTELPAESSEVFLPSEFPCPDPDAFYHALSPFSTPFDLGLERASVGSGNTAGGGSSSGTITPASQPGTPSPLDGPRPFPTVQGRHSSSLSNVLEDGSLLEPTVSGDDTSNTSNPQQTPEEELCNLLTNVLFSVTWRGVEGSDEAAWRERGQVFSVLTQLGASATLVRPPDCIKRCLLEMMLESALTDIKEAPPGSLANLTQQALWLLRLLQDFLCAEGHGNQELWSEKLFEGVCNLLDRLGAWPHLANSIPALCEMAQIGLRLVLGYILLEDPQLHAQAYVKLHTLLQTAVPARREEACYVLSKLEAALSRALNTSSSETEHAQPPSTAVAASERCSWLVPLVRTLLDRAYGPLGLQWGLPSLPPTNGSPTFFEDFQAFCATPEWRHFIDKQVQPTMSKFEMDTYAKSHDLMSGFWNACYDMLMSSGQRHQRERIQSGRAFQELVLEPAQRRARLEGLRHAAVLKQQAAQHSAALLHWGALWRQLSSPCGAWALRVPPTPHWKLSSAETYSRMRLKLVPNHHFDPHLEASALRDNLGEAPMTPTEEASLPLAVTKEAKISAPPEELLEDQLGEDEMAVLETLMEAAELDEQHEKLVLSAECQLVTVVAVVPGLLEVTTQHVYFYDGSTERVETEEGIGHDFRRPLAQLREVHLRRFNLRRSALELFFIDQSNYFLNFPCKGSGSSASSPCQAPRPQPYPIPPHTQVRNQVYSWLLRLRPHTQGYLSSRSPQEMLRASGLTQKWVQREISNFEYLMQLNTIAGRTYNDLSQYPVFPWVLQDYVSPVLDLSNPAVFRDLSKPIGVVNPKHAQLLTNEKVGDVVLPPWASCPEDFIQQHRRALESEYVSTHLHEWIDLIFGYKQRGPAAEEALNVFYYCTYEGAVDLDHVADERERKALEGIISNFGQTPCQLLKEPHPPRLSAEEAASRLARLDTNSPSIFQNLDQLKAFFAEVISEGEPLLLALVPHRQSHSFITQGSSDLLVTVSASGLLGTHSWLPYDRNINNYFTFSKDPSMGNPKMQKLLSGPWVPGSGMSGHALAVAPDGKLLFSGGHWDGSLRVTGLPRGKLLNQLSRHLDVVTCLALDTCGIYLISGSRDTTCMVWRLLQQGGFSVGLAPKPVQVLYGHEAAVSCVAISTELDMAVSGSEDGTVIIHTVRRGQFVAALRPPGATLPGPVSHLALGSEGQIVVQSSACERPGAQVTYSLHLYSAHTPTRIPEAPYFQCDTALKGQGRDRERVWAGVEGALAPNTSSFPPEPPGASSNIIPVYCALLATVVLGLLAYVAFKCWRSHKQRQQLAKARTVELGDPDRDHRHGDSSIFVDSPHCLEPCIPSQGPNPDPGCRLYLRISQQQQQEVERLLMLGEPANGWQGLASQLGYQAEVVETMARDQVPACTLLRDWAVQEGSRATLRVLQDALAAIGREDVVQVLSSSAEGCSVV